MPHPLWNQIATDADTPLNAGQLSQLDRYLDALIEQNQKLNLTRIVDRASAEVKHVADALTLLAWLPRAKAGTRLSLVDVGTGGGVPGVPLAIARPDLQVTLIDATKKKLDAIDVMLAVAQVTNAATRHGRIESAGTKFDVITARAVAEMATLLEWCGPLMHPRSVLLAMKGPRAEEEIAAIPMRHRKRFRMESMPIKVDELSGHVVVRVHLSAG